MDLIALEGATEIKLQCSLTAAPESRRNDGGLFLRENSGFSGPVHAALTRRGKLPEILGIDDPAHYQANIAAYQNSAPKREALRQAMTSLQAEIETRKATCFSRTFGF